MDCFDRPHIRSAQQRKHGRTEYVRDARGVGGGGLVLMLAGLAMVLLCGRASAAIIDDLVGNWRFDETTGTFEDISGNGQPLEPVGSPHGTGSDGVLEGAMDLDGSSFAQRPDTDSGGTVDDPFGAYGVSDTFTAALWLKQDTLPTEFQWFMGREDDAEAAGAAGWALRSGTSGRRDRLRFQFRDPHASSGLSIDSTSPVLNTTDWLHLAVVHQGSLTLADTRLFVNGAEVSASASGSFNGSTETGLPDDALFSVGARFVDTGGAVNGLIDEAGVWERALSENEIAILYNNGNGRVITPEPAAAVGLALMLTLICGTRRRHS